MRSTWLTIACLAFAAVARADDEQPKLNVGDKAPKLEVKEFVKGAAVKELAKGKNYVVEFWATWCGPCRATIPHLTELQKKHPDVTFIGVSVYEHEADAVKPFVQEMGDKMDYRVAVDAVPEKKKSDEGFMAKHWMDAAGMDGIPTAFIVNKDGVIAWIGHPGELEKPLEEVIAGKWDVKAEAMRVKEERVKERKLRALVAKIQQAHAKGDHKTVLTLLNDAIQGDAKLESMLAGLKFETLVELGDVDQAVAYGRKLVQDVYKDDPQQLNELAWRLVDPEREKKAAKKLLQVAIESAQRASKLTKDENPAVLDTLACAYFAADNVAKAVETAEKAVKLQPEDKDLKAHLEKFKKAQGKK